MAPSTLRDPAQPGNPPTTHALFPREVAARLRVSVDKVRSWIASGKLRAVNVGDGLKRPRWRIRESDLAEFEQSRLSQPPPKPARRRRKDPSITEYF